MRRGLLILAFLVPAGLALVLSTAKHQPLRAQDDQAQARMQARIKSLEQRLEVLEDALLANNQLVARLQEALGAAPSGPSRPARAEGEPLIVSLLNVRPVTPEDMAADPKARASALVRVYLADGTSKSFHVNVGAPIGKQVKTPDGLVDYRAGTLLEATVGVRKHPTLGFEQQVHRIRYQTPGGEVVETTNRDPAPGKR